MPGRKRSHSEILSDAESSDSDASEHSGRVKLDRKRKDYKDRLAAWLHSSGPGAASSGAAADDADSEDEPIAHLLVRIRQARGKRGSKATQEKQLAGAVLPKSAKPSKGLLDDVKPARRSGVGLPLNDSGLVDHDWREEKWLPPGILISGRWTAREDARLKALLVEYAREVHGLSREDLVDLVTAGAQQHDLRGFWIDFASRFRWRSVKSIFLRAYRLFLPGNYVGKWAVQDLETLRDLVDRWGKQWARIARYMGRHPTSCQVIWTARFSLPGRYTHAWARGELRRLASAVMSLREGSYVPWGLVSQRVKTRTPAQCSSKWNGSFGPRSDGVPWGPRRDAAMVACVSADGAESVEDVDWEEVGQELGGLLPAQVRARFSTLSKGVPGHRVMGLSRLCAELDRRKAAADKRRSKLAAAGITVDALEGAKKGAGQGDEPEKEQAGGGTGEHEAADGKGSAGSGAGSGAGAGAGTGAGSDVGAAAAASADTQDLAEFEGLYDRLLADIREEEQKDGDVMDALADPQDEQEDEDEDEGEDEGEVDATSSSSAASAAGTAARSRSHSKKPKKGKTYKREKKSKNAKRATAKKGGKGRGMAGDKSTKPPKAKKARVA